MDKGTGIEQHPNMELKKKMESLNGKKIIDAKDWWIKLDDGTQAHIDFMVYK